MDKAPQHYDEVAELNSRLSDKMLITLWWVKGTIDTYVTVTDLENEVEHVIDVPSTGELPHEVYNHARAYVSHEPGTV